MQKLSAYLFFYFIILFIAGSCPATASDFHGETIYLIMVDRFYDGNPDNNPKGNIFSPDKSDWRLYHGGDVQGVIKKLPYIKELGCTAIWLTPVFDNTEELYYYGDIKMAAYHGYWGRDFYSPNKYFTTEEEYRELVNKAHSMGIKIIFDFVMNHTSPVRQGIDGAIFKDGKFIADYSNDPYMWFHHLGTIDFKNPDPSEWQDKNLYDLADLNTENPEVRNYIIGAALKWLSFGIDAFRLDTVRHVPIEINAEFVTKVKAANPDVFIFGEWSNGGADVDGAVEYTQKTSVSLIDFSFTHNLRNTLCGGESFEKMKYVLGFDSRVPDPNLMVTCIDNHDMPRFISCAIESGKSIEEAKKLTNLAVYIMMTSRGIPCIYYGTERYLHHGEKTAWGYGNDPYNRQDMFGWDEENVLSRNIALLAGLRKKVSALSKGRQVVISADQNTLVYERRCKDSTALIAVNKGEKITISMEKITLPDGEYNSISGRHKKIIGPSIMVSRGKTKVELDSYEAGIWIY